MSFLPDSDLRPCKNNVHHAPRNASRDPAEPVKYAPPPILEALLRGAAYAHVVLLVIQDAGDGGGSGVGEDGKVRVGEEHVQGGKDKGGAGYLALPLLPAEGGVGEDAPNGGVDGGVCEGADGGNVGGYFVED